MWGAEGPLNWNIDIDIDVEMDVDIDRHIGSLTGVSKSVHVPVNGTEAVIVLTLIFLKQRDLDEQAICVLLTHI